MKNPSKTVQAFQETIFATMSRLALEHRAINLGQGFPDFDGPPWLLDLAKDALGLNKNQYAPSIGAPELRQMLATTYADQYQLHYHAEKEITITAGATEAIFCATLALLDPGDEVIVFEPFYDSYVASIQLAGAKAVP